MPNQVSMGAVMTCSFGVAPSSLVVLPKNKVLCEGPPAANIMDHVPMLNIMPFGMCSSPANPTVAAATAATVGLAGELHMPNGMMFSMGTWSMMLAAGGPSHSTLFFGRTTSDDGATPKLQ